MAQDKVISWAEYQSRKAIEKAANLDAKAATSPTALAKTSEAFYVPSAGSSKTKKMPKDYDFEADGTSSKKYPENRNNSYPQAKASYGYGNFDSYQKGGAKTHVGVYERCFTKRPSRQSLNEILPGNAASPMLRSNRIEAARTTPRGRNKFSYWPVCVACAVVLTSRKPLKA